MKKYCFILSLSVGLMAAETKTHDELAGLDARELHNRGTERLKSGDLAGAEEALKASLSQDEDDLRTPALHNLGHVRFNRGVTALNGKTNGDLTELSIAKSLLEAADADISDMKDQIQIIDQAKAAGQEPDYVPAVAALGQGIDTYRSVKKTIPKEEAMVAKRNNIIAVWSRSVGDFRSAHELDPQDRESLANAETIEELLRNLHRETQALAETIEAQKRKQEELKEVIKELIKRIPDDQLPKNAQGEGEEDENFLPENRRKENKGGSGQSQPKGKEGDDKKMTEQEARGTLEGLKNEFGRKMPAGQPGGGSAMGNGKGNEKKGKDY